jgi:hypothetical protein
MRLAIILAALLVAGAAFAAPTLYTDTHGTGTYEYEPGRDIKWAQYPLIGGSALSSQYDWVYPFYSECADDFFCEDGREIVAVEWWGQYWNGSPVPPVAFIIRFYSDFPGPPWSQPLDLLYFYECVNYNEEYDPQYDQYHYFCELYPPFFQEAGNIYWLSVQAVLLFPPQWGWCECDPMYYWNDEAVMDFALLGVARWTPISQIPDIGVYKELAFVLHSPPSPVEDSTWGGIKALYR